MEINTVEILLIEDNENDAELAIRALRKGNITNNLIHLKNGAEALEFLFGTETFEGRDVSNKPKIIMLDLHMPKVDGLELVGQIKTNKLTKAIPVVVLTSSNQHSDIERAYSLGANSYIVIPVEFNDFTKVLTAIGFYWFKNQAPV